MSSAFKSPPLSKDSPRQPTEKRKKAVSQSYNEVWKIYRAIRAHLSSITSEGEKEYSGKAYKMYFVGKRLYYVGTVRDLCWISPEAKQTQGYCLYHFEKSAELEL